MSRFPLLIGVGIVVLIIAGSVIYFQGSDTSSPADLTNTDAATEADLFATNVAFDQLNPDGSLNYRLVASAITQFPTMDDQPERTLLTQPQFHLSNNPEPPWDISSQQGQLTADPQDASEEILYLTEDVTMQQEHPVNGTLTIRSQSFSIFPKREYAETDDDVIIDTEVGRTEAAGMQANLATGLLTLTSSNAQKRVHTVILPEQFKQTDPTN